MKLLSGFIGFVLLSGAYYAKDMSAKQSIIDYPGFQKLTKEVYTYREKRKISVERFVELSQQNGVIVLDTRSKAAYDKKHIKGAVHLNFSDFTDKKLAQVIPSKDTVILIYCNNNFADDASNFASKRMPLALNIPTFINLYGYGYKDIYELYNLLSVSDQRIEFAGTDAK